MEIDLNADLGEGAGLDAELMPLITSANICCGLHAGGFTEIRRTLALAQRHGRTIGAHPGYEDRANFGRKEMTLPLDEFHELCIYQMLGLLSMAVRKGLSVQYVKPHGAMYNQACRDRALAAEIATIARVWAAKGIPVVGLPGSELENACRGSVAFVPEGFADRRYRADGSLVPRTEPDAFIHDPAEAVDQVERLIETQRVRTICVHGDNPQAVAFTRAVRDALLARGFTLRPFTS